MSFFCKIKDVMYVCATRKHYAVIVTTQTIEFAVKHCKRN